GVGDRGEVAVERRPANAEHEVEVDTRARWGRPEAGVALRRGGRGQARAPARPGDDEREGGRAEAPGRPRVAGSKGQWTLCSTTSAFTRTSKGVERPELDA